MPTMRLDKFLSAQLNLSRTDAKKLLRAGRVTVGGAPETKGERQLDPDAAEVSVDGNPVVYREHLYLMLHKPAGVVSSTDAPGDRTVLDLVPPELRRAGLFPAGRLDRDTTGFVLLTDDGAFAHAILSPSRHVPKTYLVTLTRPVTPEEAAAVTSGLILPDVALKPASLRFAETAPDGLPVYELVITQGIYHQVKRMFAHFGDPVVRLHRVSIGGLRLDPALSPGEMRLLTPEEVAEIRQNGV